MTRRATAAGPDSPLLEPRSIAVVGATDRPGSYGDTILRNLERLGFDGPVWGVNPRREAVRGSPCVPSLADLPEPVDAVASRSRRPASPTVIVEAGERGCGGAVVVSAGFGEIEAGRELERELREAALAARLPGLRAERQRRRLDSPRGRRDLGRLGRTPLAPGPVAMISQSGNVAVNALGSRRGIGFHTVVSTGNGAVCDAGDWLEALARARGRRLGRAVPRVRRRRREARRGPGRCAERGIGVAVLKVGSSEAGAGPRGAHTGALAGDQRVFRALIEEAGAAWARDPHELLELARVLAEPRRPAARRRRPRRSSPARAATPASPPTRPSSSGSSCRRSRRRRASGSRELLPEAATVGNPLDYTSLIWASTERSSEIVGDGRRGPGDRPAALLFDHAAGTSPRDRERTGSAVDAGARRRGRRAATPAPLLGSTLPDLIDAGRRRGARRARDRVGRRAWAPRSPARRAARRRPPSRSGCGRSPRRRKRPAAGRRAAAQGGWLGEAEAKELLRAPVDSVPEGRGRGRRRRGRVDAARELGWPVALKLSGPALQHKTETGALALDFGTRTSCWSAAERLLALPEAAGAELLVERMAAPGGRADRSPRAATRSCRRW